MILELDVGNSRIKWRLITVEDLAFQNGGHASSFEELIVEPELVRATIKMARMCSVRSGDINKKIEEWVLSQYKVELVQALVTQSCGGVTNQYTDVGRLGIDRWLAMVAAYNRAKSACMIVDSGTAFTIDVVDEKGLHMGGYILPGLALMRSSLEAKTAIRLSRDYKVNSANLGHSTDEAVFHGTLMALVSTIRQQDESLGRQAVKTYFAGGDAELLHSLAGLEGSEVMTSLVFEGLAVICPYPEN